MKKTKISWEHMAELRNEFGQGTKMVRLVLTKDGKLKPKYFTVK